MKKKKIIIDRCKCSSKEIICISGQQCNFEKNSCEEKILCTEKIFEQFFKNISKYENFKNIVKHVRIKIDTNFEENCLQNGKILGKGGSGFISEMKKWFSGETFIATKKSKKKI